MMELRTLTGAHRSASSVRPPDVPVSAPSRWSALFGRDGFSFGDVFDLVNPLQHIPVVGNLYRKLTGDLIAPGMRIAGGALFGGPLGALLSTGGLLLEHAADDTPNGPATATPNSAIAETGSAQPYRGGWIVNAAMSGHRTPEIPTATVASGNAAPDPGTATRRGGWLVAQAYALDDLPLRPTPVLHAQA